MCPEIPVAAPANRQSPFSISNIRRYIAFKVLFNARFYYPVFTILFLDFGLSVAQFSILNAVWAATIVLAEVPSGALADTIGRKRLLVFATLTMVVEVGMIAFVPTGNITLVFWIFLINRVLSGLAEAAASGADEALAYDALKKYGDPSQWGRVLEVLTRCQSVGFIIAMTLGAAIYDPALMNALAQGLGIGITVTQDTCMRFPLYGTLILGMGACVATMGMVEISTAPSRHTPETAPTSRNLTQAFILTFKAGRWILTAPFVLWVILFGMLLDSSIRMVITLSSQYYRMILLPESIFGIIGAGVAMLGFFVPSLARKLAERKPPEWGLYLTTSLTALGLIGMNVFWPWLGMIPALITYSAMYFNNFFVSFYINRETPSAQRATVLSFKGLSYNLAYGVYGMIYALILKLQRQGLDPDLAGPAMDNLAFKESFFIFPTLFMIGFIGLWALLKTRPFGTS